MFFMKRKYIIYGLLIGTCSLSSCEKFFEVDTNDILLDENYVGESNELYSGYIGVASKMQAIGDQTVFLSDLRTDLLEPTHNAPQDLWDIYNFKETQGNEFANPSAYYDLIVNANNYIGKVVEYRKQNPKVIEEAHYKGLISGALRFKIWTYLTIGKLYGKVAYFDNPNLGLDDISSIPVISLDELIPKLLDLMLTGVDGVNGMHEVNWATILFPGDGSAAPLSWNMICPAPEPLLMELYLWNKQYEQVVSIGIDFIARPVGTDQRYYKVGADTYDAKWVNIFNLEHTHADSRLANITIVPYDYERNQTNRLVSFFSNIPPSVYYLRPTMTAIARHERQLQYDGNTIGDLWRGNERTYHLQNGDWIFRKFTRARESAAEVHKNNGHVIIYRDSDVHFFLIEALNNLGYFKQAEALLNDGVEQYVNLNRDNLEYPFNDEVKNAVLTRNWGIRRRVKMYPVYPAGLTRPEADDAEDVKNAYKKAMDKLVVEETLMESAGEAKAFFAMVRIAKRWQDNTILADVVSKKYGSREDEIRNYLMTESNWYINYPLD